MNETAKGKIGRLPMDIREEANRRLDHGEDGVSLAAWLNSLPEVQAVLAAEFGGKPVRKQNISEWRKHGYKRWRWRQEAMAMVEEVRDLPTDTASLMNNMTNWAAVHYLVAVRELVEREAERQEAGAEPRSQLKLLQRFCKDVNSLRRGEYSSARLELMKARQERMTSKIQNPKSNNRSPAGQEHSTPKIRGRTSERASGSPQREDCYRSAVFNRFGA